MHVCSTECEEALSAGLRGQPGSVGWSAGWWGVPGARHREQFPFETGRATQQSAARPVESEPPPSGCVIVGQGLRVPEPRSLVCPRERVAL